MLQKKKSPIETKLLRFFFFFFFLITVVSNIFKQTKTLIDNVSVAEYFI